MSDTVNAVLLIPLDITESMIAAGTSVPVVDSAAGEVAWVPGQPYVVDETVNHIGSLWDAVAANTDVAPGTNPNIWHRRGPTNRMAAFDPQLNTVTRWPGEILYVLRPGFLTGLGIRGMVGDHLNITIYDEPGGVIVAYYDGDLYEQAAGLYELLFTPLGARTQHYMSDLPLTPDAEVHISITAASGVMCEVVLITIGHWDTLIGAGTWGGTEYNAEAAIKSYTYRKVEDDGSVTRKRRGASSNVDCQVVIPATEGNHAMELLHKVQGRPVAAILSGLPIYEYLNGFGDVSGTVTAAGPNHARVRLRIEGEVEGVKN